MATIGQELLLLMLNLSCMSDREQIVRVFVEALSAAIDGVTVRRIAKGETTSGDLIDVATPDACFERMAIEDPAGALSEADRAELRNAIRMLASAAFSSQPGSVSACRSCAWSSSQGIPTSGVRPLSPHMPQTAASRNHSRRPPSRTRSEGSSPDRSDSG